MEGGNREFLEGLIETVAFPSVEIPKLKRSLQPASRLTMTDRNKRTPCLGSVHHIQPLYLTMKFLTAVALALSCASSTAFVQKSKAGAGVALDACISKEEVLKTPNTYEFGGIWDPLGLADIGSDETLAWYRHAEIKHGRVAMAAVRDLLSVWDLSARSLRADFLAVALL